MHMIHGYRRSYTRFSYEHLDQSSQLTALMRSPCNVWLVLMFGKHMFCVQESRSLRAAADVCNRIVRHHRQRTPNLLQAHNKLAPCLKSNACNHSSDLSVALVRTCTETRRLQHTAAHGVQLIDERYITWKPQPPV